MSDKVKWKEFEAELVDRIKEITECSEVDIHESIRTDYKIEFIVYDFEKKTLDKIDQAVNDVHDEVWGKEPVGMKISDWEICPVIEGCHLRIKIWI